jgi:bacterioferritin (cytochrome b1)
VLAIMSGHAKSIANLQTAMSMELAAVQPYLPHGLVL